MGVTAREVEELISKGVGGRRLLSHPFYRRWESGTLGEGELAAYAEQYRHVEAALPEVLGRIARATPVGPARDAVEANLADELGRPAPHLELFDSFLSAVGGRGEVPASAATRSLVELQLASAAKGTPRGLAVLSTYESQAVEVATSKADGLRRFYGIDPTGTAFWDVHATLEAEHAGWSFDALSTLAPVPAEIVESVTAAAKAWWAFLDEREAAA